MSCLLAICLELGLGLSVANGQDPGIWYMDGPQYPHVLHLTSPELSVGATGEHWRAGLQYLGKFGADARAIASNDPTLIGCAPGCYPMSTWHGSGKVYGAYAQYVAHWGAWRAEAGPWVYRATWEERVPDYAGRGTCTQREPRFQITDCNVSTDKTSVGAIGGIGRDFGPYSAVMSIAMASDRGVDRSIIKNAVATFQVRRTF